MVSYEQMINGITTFFDKEVINKLTGTPRVLMGVGMGIALKNGRSIYDTLKESSVAKMLNLIDSNGNIDVETVYDELKKYTHRDNIEIEMPIIGTLRLNEGDVDKLFYYIKNN